MTLVAEYCQRVIAFRDGVVSFSGTPEELFEDQASLGGTGLQSPPAAALSARFREEDARFPPLLTVAQWSNALRESREAETVAKGSNET